MNIALLTSSFLPTLGGAEVAIHQEAMHLLEFGHRVVVFTPYRSTGGRYRLPYPVLPLWPKTFWAVMRYPRLGQLYMSLQMVRHLWRRSFDVWHVHFAYPAGYSILSLVRQNSLPAILTCPGADIQKDVQSNYGFRLNPDIERRIKETLQEFTRLIAVSESVKKEYLELGVNSERIQTIPYGVDFERLSCKVDREEIRRRLEIAPGEKMILTVGRNHPKKGFRFLVEAAAQLKSRTALSFRVFFVGRGVSDLQPLAQSLGVDGCIRTLEQIDGSADGDDLNLPPKALIELYQAADIFVLPSLIETFGLVLVEAMACELPIITTDAPGCRDVIEHDVNGLLVSPGNSVALASGLQRVLEDSQLAQRLSAQAKILARPYDWKCITQQYINVFKEVVGKGRQ